MYRNIADMRVFNFSLVCSKLPNCFSRVQEFITPEMSIEPVRVQAHIPVSQVFIPGDGLISADRFSISILLDEEMKSYFDIYDWMVAIRNQENIDSHMFAENSNVYADISLLIRGNNQQLIATNTFYDCFPIRLGQLTHKTTSGSDEVVTFTADFSFSRQILSKTYLDIPPKQEV